MPSSSAAGRLQKLPLTVSEAPPGVRIDELFLLPAKEQGAAHQRALSPLPANSTAKQLTAHPSCPSYMLGVGTLCAAGQPAPNRPLCQPFACSCTVLSASERQKPHPPRPQICSCTLLLTAVRILLPGLVPTLRLLLLLLLPPWAPQWTKAAEERGG